MPRAQVAENLLHQARIINDRDDAHGVLGDRAAQRVNMPDAQYEIPAPLGGQFQGRWRRNARTVRDQLWRQPSLVHCENGERRLRGFVLSGGREGVFVGGRHPWQAGAGPETGERRFCSTVRSLAALPEWPRRLRWHPQAAFESVCRG
jgi:hypothetical protein